MTPKAIPWHPVSGRANEWRGAGGVCYNVPLLKCSFTAG